MTFSVIVPTHNRVSLLKNTLNSLYRQDFSDFEIIVVNDGSTDATDEYMRSIVAEKNISYLQHENRGLAATRDAGLRIARGTYIAFTDDDCVLPQNWLSQLYAIFREQGAVCIGGSCITGNPENPFAEANDMMQNYFKEAGNNPPGKVPFFTGNNVAYTRAVLEQVGGPDKRFRMGAEDRDLLFRVARTGGKIVYAPRVAIQHFNDSTLRSFVRHQFEFGEGSFFYYHLTASSEHRPAAFPLSVYLGVFAYPFTLRPAGRALLLMLLIVVAQAAITVGFVTRWLRQGFVAADKTLALA
jgi:GT2 family glycosyltransferase